MDATMIFTLAWRNTWRQRRRTIFGLAAVAVTTVVVVFLPSFQAGSYSGMVNAYLGLLDGYAQIQLPGYLHTPAMRESFEVPAPLRETLRELPAGVDASERGIAYVLLSSEARSLGAQVIGVAPQTERRVSTIPSDLVSGVYLEKDDQIVLGETLARNLQVAEGDAVTLLGVGRDGSLAAEVRVDLNFVRSVGVNPLGLHLESAVLEQGRRALEFEEKAAELQVGHLVGRNDLEP